VSQQIGKHKCQSKDPGTTLMFDRIQYDVRIKTINQDERHTQSDTGEHGETSAGVYHRAGQRGDLVAIQIKVLK
jgi:hypothetical protein